MGFSGVQNFPTIGLFDGVMRASFEETGMGYGLEVDMIAQAHDLDLLTTPYVFNPDEAEAMTKAGADIIVAHMGVTTRRLDRRDVGEDACKDCVPLIDAIAEAAREGAERHHRALPRRADRHAGGRRVHPAELRGAATASTAPRAWSACRSRSALTEQTRNFKKHRLLTAARGRLSMAGKFVIAKDTEPEILDWGRLALAEQSAVDRRASSSPSST